MGILPFSLNRTIVGLKLRLESRTTKSSKALNRTIVGLKQVENVGELGAVVGFKSHHSGIETVNGGVSTKTGTPSFKSHHSGIETSFKTFFATLTGAKTGGQVPFAPIQPDEPRNRSRRLE